MAAGPVLLFLEEALGRGDLAHLLQAARQAHRPAGAEAMLPALDQRLARRRQHQAQARAARQEVFGGAQIGGLQQGGVDARTLAHRGVEAVGGGSGAVGAEHQRNLGGGALDIEQRGQAEQGRELVLEAQVAADQAQLLAGAAAGVDIAARQGVGVAQAAAAARGVAQQQGRLGLAGLEVVMIGLVRRRGARGQGLHLACQQVRGLGLARQQEHGGGVDGGEVAAGLPERGKIGLGRGEVVAALAAGQGQVLEQAALQGQPVLVDLLLAQAQLAVAAPGELGAAGIGQGQQGQVLQAARLHAQLLRLVDQVVAQQVVAGAQRLAGARCESFSRGVAVCHVSPCRPARYPLSP